MLAELAERLHALMPWEPPEPFDACDAPEAAYRRALDRAAAEGRRLRDRWRERLAAGELEYAPVTAYALARPAPDIEATQLTAAPAGLLAELYADPRHVAGLAEALAGLDLRPVVRGATSVTFETTVGRLRDLFGASLVADAHPVIVSPLGVVWQPYLRLIDPVVAMPPALRRSALLVDIERPVTLAQSPPAPGYLHITPGQSLRDVVNCVSMAAYEGRGVGMAVVDTGVALAHPHFKPHRRRVRVVLVPDARFKRHDPWGHGTALAAAALAIAPGVDLTMVKMPLTAQQAGLRRYAADAVIAAMSAAPAPRVVVCAWGLDERGSLPPRWRTEILTLSAQHDTLFVCAAGNGQPTGRGGDHFHPANLDEVLAVGGAYQDTAGDYVAADYTSSFTGMGSGRHCPDIAGPSGPAPLGVYLMAPTDEVSYFDVLQHGRGRRFPDGDETAPGDGWCGMGGSSTAAAVVAGAAAIIRGAHPGLSAAETKDILMRTAADIPYGRSVDGHDPRAAGGPAPWAGGMGMVDCHAALSEALLAKIAQQT